MNRSCPGTYRLATRPVRHNRLCVKRQDQPALGDLSFPSREAARGKPDSRPDSNPGNPAEQRFRRAAPDSWVAEVRS